ncbi:hypothetical protein KNU05_gp189 [Synechococcus virus S-PRM1]|uniref:Uncharacterized protein n=1 Tax=Synechococcus virus S-PRM1 TaxID=2100130 RepID=A0A346FK60_9CAUD|nr:hypothetical protein KNU05_gp189 [Synechococcus virus S-PRM1]AXN58365.1 hypothetical protein [Synechococcus virus S-PRM1]
MSAAGLEVGPLVALHHQVTAASGVAVVCLTSAVGVGAGPFGHAEHQLALAGLAGGQFGHGELARGDASIKFRTGHDVGW